MSGNNVNTVDAVADFFLQLQDISAGDTISHLKLQKLVYYVQAWHLALKGTAAFTDDIEAWAHGPVVRRLYNRFKEFGWQAISPYEIVTDPAECLPDTIIEVAEAVWHRYGNLSGKQLEDQTHSEDPWIDAYKPVIPGGACSNIIEKDDIQKYFSQQLQAA